MLPGHRRNVKHVFQITQDYDIWSIGLLKFFYDDP